MTVVHPRIGVGMTAMIVNDVTPNPDDVCQMSYWRQNKMCFRRNLSG